ncbi:MAG: hypothetical protein ACK5PD_12770 [Pirellulaceae bacterium]|jgi:uncharacterized phiE125 gp8 family phage protein
MQEIHTRILTPPASEPVSIKQAKKQLELLEADDAHDEQLQLLIEVARDSVERDCGIAMLTQTVEHIQPGFYEAIQLQRRPVQSVTSVQYYDDGNVLRTLSASIWQLNQAKERIELQYEEDWPTTATRWDAVKVTYVAGYTSAATVPASLRQAMLLKIGYLFENRDQITSQGMMSEEAYERIMRRWMRPSYP